MGGLSSNPIRCANQNSERKDPGREICPEGNNERKEPFKSKCDSGTCWDYFMAYAIIESISMSTLWRVCFLLSCHFLSATFFQTPLSYLQVPFYKVSSYSIIAWDWRKHGKGRAQVGLAFRRPLLLFLSFFSIILLFFLETTRINLWAFNPSSHEKMEHQPLPKCSTLW